MNGVELLLLDLVRMSETPLYSAYRWLGAQLGRPVSMEEFLRIVDRLVADKALQLWSVDPSTERRESIGRVPEPLALRYEQCDQLDASFDPFSLSLTLGSAAEQGGLALWDADFDFERNWFRLTANKELADQAVRSIEALFPDVGFVKTRTRDIDSTRVEVTGSIRESGAR